MSASESDNTTKEAIMSASLPTMSPPSLIAKTAAAPSLKIELSLSEPSSRTSVQANFYALLRELDVREGNEADELMQLSYAVDKLDEKVHKLIVHFRHVDCKPFHFFSIVNPHINKSVGKIWVCLEMKSICIFCTERRPRKKTHLKFKKFKVPCVLKLQNKIILILWLSGLPRKRLGIQFQRCYLFARTENSKKILSF